MPQISDKRSPKHAKENLTQINNKGIEILDFRESWLQEIEMYKKQVRVQQLLTTHNNLPTADEPKTNVVEATTKRRIRTRSNPDPQDKFNSHQDHDNELVLKRPREEIPITKGHENGTNEIHTKTYTNHNGKTMRPTAAAVTNGHKIIINNYHASSLITPNQLDNKHKAAQLDTTFNASNQISHINSNGSNANNKSSKINSPTKFEVLKSPKLTNKVITKNVVEENLVTTTTIVPIVEPEPISLPPSRSPTPNDEIICKTDGTFKSEIQTESKSDDDVGSNLDDDDDDDFGDIDNVHLFDDDSSDDSDNEYVGYSFALNTDELKEPADTDSCSDISKATYPTPQSILTPSLFPMVPPYLTFSSHAEKGPFVMPELHKVLKWKLSPVMPRIVKRVVLNSGFRLIKKTTDWIAVWEKHMKSPGFKTIRSHQKYNHIPGSFKIGRKDSVWRNLKTYMMKYGKQEFGFMQKTFILPQELDLLKKSWPKYAKKSTKWIVKPPASARGVGISVVNKWSDFPKQKPLIVQKYVERPFLINKSKFDLRLYIIVTSINPLRIYMHKEGLARFASVQYSNDMDSLNDRCMHLTNYSINKLSASYAKNEDINACQGHKWTLKALWSYLKSQGHNTNRVWGTLRNLVIKTIIGGEGCLNKMFRQNVNSHYNCYELFGFDVLLDENLVPWLLEVNISPSLHSDLPLDMHIKGPLIQATLNTALYQVPPKFNETQKSHILREMQLSGPLCYDKRLFTTCLSQEEIHKHNHYTSKSIEFREEYLESILDNLTPDDLRCLIIAEDELARSAPLERVFPSPESHIYLKFIESPRYYNRLIDAWETKYAGRRADGIVALQGLCKTGRHLEVPAAALAEEPHVEFTDIDLLHVNLNKSPVPTPNQNTSDDVKPTTDVVDSSSSPNPISEQYQNCSKQAHNDQRNSSNDYSHNRPITVEYIK